MRIPAKYRLWVAAVYSAYFTLATFVLNPFVFLENHDPLITYPLIFAFSFLASLSLIKLTAKSFATSISHLLVIASLFVISISCGMLVWLLNDSAETDLLLYYNSFLILPVLPASVYILWLVYFDLSTRFVVSTENQQMTDDSVQKMFRITNNQNQVILESPIERIIAFEANDNYVHTYHLTSDGSVEKMMHRISLKKITELLDQIDTHFHRVHKSYLVNPEFVQKVKGKSQAYRLQLIHLSIEVPVSRTFDIKSIQLVNPE
ncbi:MAG: LytTR family DNA-binding domain-containing protein [Crocinitomicaceae bacterium]|nr:LytTR family DNA-binding domain-containing protein [Crocinitomicaceae bacterium]